MSMLFMYSLPCSICDEISTSWGCQTQGTKVWESRTQMGVRTASSQLCRPRNDKSHALTRICCAPEGRHGRSHPPKTKGVHTESAYPPNRSRSATEAPSSASLPPSLRQISRAHTHVCWVPEGNQVSRSHPHPPPHTNTQEVHTKSAHTPGCPTDRSRSATEASS